MPQKYKIALLALHLPTDSLSNATSLSLLTPLTNSRFEAKNKS